MIKVNCKNGKTLSFNLADDKEANEWQKLSGEGEFQSQITGIGILYNTQWHTLPMPKRFRRIDVKAELIRVQKEGIMREIGERIVYQADDIQISLIVYYGNRPKMARIDVKKIGKKRFTPMRGNEYDREKNC